MGFLLGGIVAGEGSFGITTQRAFVDGTPRLRFVFQVSLATRDRHLLLALRNFVGYGSIQDHPSRKRGWEPMSVFGISSRRGHRRATIPFAERFLLPSAKRRQYEQWRIALDSYDAIRPSRWGKGPSPCSVTGCDQPVRGRGLCRSHYYRATGY